MADGSVLGGGVPKTPDEARAFRARLDAMLKAQQASAASAATATPEEAKARLQAKGLGTAPPPVTAPVTPPVTPVATPPVTAPVTTPVTTPVTPPVTPVATPQALPTTAPRPVAPPLQLTAPPVNALAGAPPTVAPPPVAPPLQLTAPPVNALAGAPPTVPPVNTGLAAAAAAPDPRQLPLNLPEPVVTTPTTPPVKPPSLAQRATGMLKTGAGAMGKALPYIGAAETAYNVGASQFDDKVQAGAANMFDVEQGGLAGRALSGLAALGQVPEQLLQMAAPTMPSFLQNALPGNLNKPGAPTTYEQMSGGEAPRSLISDAIGVFKDGKKANDAAKAAQAAAQAQAAVAQDVPKMDYNTIGRLTPEEVLAMQAQMATDKSLTSQGGNIYRKNGTNEFIGVGLPSSGGAGGGDNGRQALLDQTRLYQLQNRPSDYDDGSGTRGTALSAIKAQYDEQEKALLENAKKYSMGPTQLAQARDQLTANRYKAMEESQKTTQAAMDAQRERTRLEMNTLQGLDAKGDRMKEPENNSLMPKNFTELLNYKKFEADQAESAAKRQSEATGKLGEKVDKGHTKMLERLDQTFADQPEKANKLKALAAKFDPKMVESISVNPVEREQFINDLQYVMEFGEKRNQSADSSSGDMLKTGAGAAVGAMLPKGGAMVGKLGDGILKMIPGAKPFGQAKMLETALGTRLGGAAVGSLAGYTGMFGMMPDSVPQTQQLDLPPLNAQGTALNTGDGRFRLEQFMNDPTGYLGKAFGGAGQIQTPGGAFVDANSNPDLMNALLRIQQQVENAKRQQ